MTATSRTRKTSAGLLLYRFRGEALEVLLVHPGGPYWQRKDAGAWSLPKGEYDDAEDPLQAARREFLEETGQPAPDGKFIPLSPVKQAGGKVVTAWAIEADLDPDAIRSNVFALEWPPRSGRQQEFAEIDRAAWFRIETAAEKLIPGQRPLLVQLAGILQR